MVNLLAIALSFLSASAFAQGTFQYDQQSSTESLLGEFSASIQSSQPFGQSFTPSLSAVGFVRLRLQNASGGGVLYVNLRENSAAGNVLGVSSTVSLPSGFLGFTDFIFPTPVSVTPGVTYFFQPVIESGNGWFTDYHNGFFYPGGTAIFQGAASPTFDLWFREGVVVPEPGTWALILVGLGVLAWARRFLP